MDRQTRSKVAGAGIEGESTTDPLEWEKFEAEMRQKKAEAHRREEQHRRKMEEMDRRIEEMEHRTVEILKQEHRKRLLEIAVEVLGL